MPSPGAIILVAFADVNGVSTMLLIRKRPRAALAADAFLVLDQTADNETQCIGAICLDVIWIRGIANPYRIDTTKQDLH